MQFLKRYLIVCLLILQGIFLKDASAQELRYRSDLITRENGLSNSTVTSIIKDHYGFIWIGTWNGLNRFDGYDMTVFQFDPNDNNSISNSNVNMLFEDSTGLLWIATDNGLNSYDRITGKFQRYFVKNQHPSEQNNQINSITQDSQGYIWIGCQNEGLIRFDKNKGIFKQYKNRNSERSNSVITLMADRFDKDLIWLGTADGLFIFNQASGDYKKMVPVKSDFPVYIQIFTQDMNGNIYLGTWGNGLLKIDRKTSKISSCTTPDEKDAIIRAMSFDGKGNLIYDVRDKGLRSYNLSSGSVIRLNHGNITNELNDKVVTSMFIEPSGIMWIGTIYDGAIKIVSLVNSFNFFQLQTGNILWSGGGITAIVEDAQGTLWLGTRFGGLYKFQRPTGKITVFTTLQGLSSNNILSLVEVREGNQRYLLIGTDGGGLNKLNILTGKISPFRISGTGSENHKTSSVSTIIQYDDEHLIFGTRDRNEGEGLYVYNLLTGNSVNFRYDPSEVTSIGSNNVLTLFKDKSGIVWVGTRNGGLNKFVIKKLDAGTPENTGYFIRYMNDPDIPNSINNNTVYSIHDDNSGNNLWIGTNNGGLSKFTPTTGEFSGDLLHSYLSDHLVYGILSDNNENLWISTSQGIMVINVNTGAIHSFDKSDGLRETAFIYGSYYKSSSGELFFGGIRGCNSFHPDSIRLNLKVPQIVITSFTLSGKKGIHNISELTGKSVLASKTVNTPYYQNNIALTFSALDYSMPAKNRFRYKLEGYDLDWNETNAARRYVNYTNLAPGKYIFKVIGSNSDDIWNHEGTSVTINIEPPFWKTSGFYSILLIFTASVLGFLVYLIVRRYRWEKEQMAKEAISLVQDEKKQLRTLIDNIPDLIFIKDRQSRFTLANNKVASLMGTVPDKLIGKTDFDFYDEETARVFYNNEQKIMDCGIPMINIEEIAHDEFGNRTIRATTKVPIKNKNGEIIGVAGVCRDITKLKNIENELRKKSEALQETNRLLENRQKEILVQSEELAEQTQNLLMINAELERLNRTKDKLFSIIAHDLRNPFNAIIGFSDLLRHDFYDMDNDQKLNVLELINISSQTAYNLLENLLQWARTQTDKINYCPEDFNLKEITGSVIDLHCATARKKGICIENAITESVQVHADKNMISTVIRNLVSNAIKYTNPDGKIVISVTDNPQVVEVSVSDNGIGMDRDSLNKLFRIDTYYSTTGTMGESGTGLGLIICKEFVEKNRGRIRAESNKGEGTTMKFTLIKADTLLN